MAMEETFTDSYSCVRHLQVLGFTVRFRVRVKARVFDGFLARNRASREVGYDTRRGIESV